MPIGPIVLAASVAVRRRRGRAAARGRGGRATCRTSSRSSSSVGLDDRTPRAIRSSSSRSTSAIVGDRRGREAGESRRSRRDVRSRRRRGRSPTRAPGPERHLPFGLRHYWKGHFFRDLDAAARRARSLEAIERRPSQHPSCSSRRSRRSRTEPDGGAAFGQRAASWNVSALAIWDDPADDEQEMAWARADESGDGAVRR